MNTKTLGRWVWHIMFPDYEQRMLVMSESAYHWLTLWEEYPELMPTFN